MKRRLLVATGNMGKVEEIRRIIGDRYELLCNTDFERISMPEEDGATFGENAAKKALSVAIQAGVPTLADDSGLVVYALGGEPGVLSARYGGETARSDEDRYELLLSRLADVPDGKRGARFVSALALAVPDRVIAVTEGVCEGRIIREPKGNNGFGYDPVFVPKGKKFTYAEMDGSEKDSISHRFRAIVAMLPHLSKLLG